MWRTFLLHCSAVVLRVFGGLATVAGFHASWVDPVAIWISWVVPLALFEGIDRGRRKGGKTGIITSR